MVRNVCFYIPMLFITVFMFMFSVHVISVKTHHEGFVLEKFVSLLRLKMLFNLSFHKEVDVAAVVVHVHNHHKLPLLSAPSPSPALSPPLSYTHPPLPQPLRTTPLLTRGSSSGSRNKMKMMRRRRMVLVAVFVSVGGLTLLILTGIVVIWFLRKLRRNGKHRSMHASPQASTASNNVGLNPKLDLYHIHALNADLEQHPFSHSDSLTRIQNQHQNHGTDDENVSCSVTSTREILSVHKSVDSIVGYESESIASVSGCKHDSTDHHHQHDLSDEEESFHSVYASNSSSSRLSNASVVDTFSPNRNGLIPPPPPPPPPPPRTFPNSKSFANSVKVNKCTDPSELNATRPPSLTQPPPPPPPLPSSSKAQPPPQPVLSNFIPLGENGSPLPKLKPLHWDKVRAEPDKSMVWDKLKSSSFRLDEEMIESLFGYNLKNSTIDDTVKSNSPSPSKHVLDPKRLQNITILSKALNITADQVCHALLLGTGLSLQQLEALMKMVPTIDEAQNLTEYNGNINDLGSAEQFVKMIISIPFSFPRIEAMLYMEIFEDEVSHLRKSFSVLEDACTELRSSRLFLKLLEAVLKTGNRMNVGTVRGGAKAFKLDALLKLSDIKGTDGKTTLLHFVVQEMVRSEGQKEAKTIVGRMNQRKRSIEEREEHYKAMGLELISSLSNELTNVKKTASIDLEVLAMSVSNLTHGMAKLRKLVDVDLAGDDGGFVKRTRLFLEYGEESLKELEEEERSVVKHVKEISEYFHGALSKEEGSNVRIFVIVRDFLGMLDLVCKELKSLKTSNGPNPLAPFKLT